MFLHVRNMKFFVLFNSCLISYHQKGVAGSDGGSGFYWQFSDGNFDERESGPRIKFKKLKFSIVIFGKIFIL